MGDDNATKGRQERDIAARALVCAAGIIVALVFCFVAYPRLQTSYEALLDPDGFGRIGRNLWQGHGFCFSPESGPTLYRGPLYPTFLALVLFASGGRFPGDVWVAQSVLHGLTCLLAYLAALRWWNRRTALWTGLACAFYPVLFWYVPRMWNDGLLAFLVGLLLYLCTLAEKDSRLLKAFGIGALLGGLCLTKGTFLVFIVVLPVCLRLWPPRLKTGHVLAVAATAILYVAPWACRNAILAKGFVPVHTGAGFNMKVGNAFARDFLSSPFSYRTLWQKNVPGIEAVPRDRYASRASWDAQSDRVYLRSALSEMGSEPLLILKKVLTAGAMFWYIGDTPTKTLVLVLLRLPVLALAAVGAWRSLRGRRRQVWLPLAFALVYWICHVPFAPPSRLSVPLMPTVLAFAVSVWTGKEGKQA